MSAELQHAGALVVQQMLGVCRTLGMYDPANHAVTGALHSFATAINVFVPPGGRATVEFVDNMLMINDQRVHPNTGLAPHFEYLHGMFREREVGGFAFCRPMDVETLRHWFARFSAPVGNDPLSKQRARSILEEVVHLGIEPLQTRTLGDDDVEKVKMNTMGFAMQTYARTVLSFREYVNAVMLGNNPYANPLNILRVVQDLVEVVNESSSNLLRILQLQAAKASTTPETYPQVHAAHTAIYALLIARLFGLRRIELLDVGTAALLANIGYEVCPELMQQLELAPTDKLLHEINVRVAPLVAGEGAVGLETVKRLTVLSEHRQSFAADNHPYARIVSVAEAFDRRTNPCEGRQVVSLGAGLDELGQGAGTQFDPLVVEGLSTILKTYYASAQQGG